MDTAVGQVSKDKKNQHIARALQFNIIKGGEEGGGIRGLKNLKITPCSLFIFSEHSKKCFQDKDFSSPPSKLMFTNSS